jgi:phage N-6-adenine-methyltransferase
MTMQLFDAERIPRNQPIVHGSHNLNGKIEWYTPPKYIEAAVKVMGGIDCDPCTSELAQQVVQATKFYTIDTNGLLHDWKGRVWMNPPYASKVITKFVEKLLAHLDDGSVNQAIMLTHNNADTTWFHKAAMRSDSVCFTRGRVRFYDEKGEGNSPTHGHVFIYFGKRKRKFETVFSEFGWICRKVAV